MVKKRLKTDPLLYTSFLYIRETERRAQEAEERSFTVESTLKDAEEKIRSLERALKKTEQAQLKASKEEEDTKEEGAAKDEEAVTQEESIVREYLYRPVIIFLMTPKNLKMQMIWTVEVITGY